MSKLSLIYTARALRAFGDGFAVIVLPLYLIELGYGPAQIGVVATAALLGSAVMTLGVGVLARRHETHKLLVMGAMLMTATGTAFPNCEQLLIIGVVAFVGTINPSSGDIGVLVPLEHATIAEAAAAEERTRVFARYSLIGALATAVGALAAAAPDWLAAADIGRLTWLRAMFMSTLCSVS